MRLLFWFTVCLITVDSVLSQFRFDLTKPFGGIFDIINQQPFSNTADVSTLHKAINAKNPDEDTIINILATTNAYDREILSQMYQNSYGINLVNDLRDKLTGKFEEAVVALMTPLNQYYSQEISDAIFGKADEKALIDTLCIFNHSLLNTVKVAYSQYSGRSIEYDLLTNTVGSFKKLMIACNQNLRDRSTIKDLFYLEFTNVFNDDDIINYLTKRSFAQILQLTLSYKNLSGIKLEDRIKDKFSGDFQRALLGIVDYGKAERLYFAKRFREILEGKEMDHRSLIRLVIMDKTVSYSEVQEIYEDIYGKNLNSFIASKIPYGSYRKLIEALLRHK